jgi:hypothetical protein
MNKMNELSLRLWYFYLLQLAEPDGGWLLADAIFEGRDQKIDDPLFCTAGLLLDLCYFDYPDNETAIDRAIGLATHIDWIE